MPSIRKKDQGGKNKAWEFHFLYDWSVLPLNSKWLKCPVSPYVFWQWYKQHQGKMPTTSPFSEWGWRRGVLSGLHSSAFLPITLLLASDPDWKVLGRVLRTLNFLINTMVVESSFLDKHLSQAGYQAQWVSSEWSEALNGYFSAQW